MLRYEDLHPLLMKKDQTLDNFQYQLVYSWSDDCLCWQSLMKMVAIYSSRLHINVQLPSCKTHFLH